MIVDFFKPDSKNGLYIQYRVLRWDSDKRRHYPVSQFWSDRDLSRLDDGKVYFFSPSYRPFGKNVVLGSLVAWADFDHVKFGGVDFRGLVPSLQVLSGGGVHAYWRFDDFVSVEDLAVVLGLISSRFHSDLLARDVTRFMRVPGSKNPKYDPPVVCSVLAQGPDYTFDDFVRVLMTLSAHPRTPSPLSPLTRASDRVTLWRRGSPDGEFWFWQSSQPYQIGSGDFVSRDFDSDQGVEVLTLGGRDVLFSGLLVDVPDHLRCYLTEVRFVGALSHA